ncbi:hypothetical protein [Dongia sp.]|uniref:hypothetical protein n=1 Tax=Dongia sp. TaxID=1977262 RepID=UPI003750AE34
MLGDPARHSFNPPRILRTGRNCGASLPNAPIDRRSARVDKCRRTGAEARSAVRDGFVYLVNWHRNLDCHCNLDVDEGRVRKGSVNKLSYVRLVKGRGLWLGIILVIALATLAISLTGSRTIPRSCFDHTPSISCLEALSEEYSLEAMPSDQSATEDSGAQKELLIQLSSRKLNIRLSRRATVDKEQALEADIQARAAEISARWETSLNKSAPESGLPDAVIDLDYSRSKEMPTTGVAPLMIDPSASPLPQDGALSLDPVWIKIRPGDQGVGLLATPSMLLCQPQVLYSGPTVVGVVSIADFAPPHADRGADLSRTEQALLKACFYYSIGLPIMSQHELCAAESALQMLDLFRTCLSQSLGGTGRRTIDMAQFENCFRSGHRNPSLP